MPAHPSRVSAAAPRACWIEAPGRAAIRDRADGRARRRRGRGPGAAQRASAAAPRSLVFRGEVPASEFERMRAPFQAGDFPGPVKYGYASVGIVEQGPDALVGPPRLLPVSAPDPLRGAGRRGAPAARRPAARRARCWPPTWRPRSTRSGTRRRGVGDRIAVVGGGVVGLLVAWLAGTAAGLRGRSWSTRRPRAAPWPSGCGVAFALPEAGAARGRPRGARQRPARGPGHGAGAWRPSRPRVLELSWYGQRPVPLPLGEAFHSRRLTLRSSQVGHVAAAQRSRWSAPAAAGAGACRCCAIRCSTLLITDSAPFDAAARGAGAPGRRCAGHRCASASTTPEPSTRQEAPHVQRQRPRPLHDRPQLSRRGLRSGAAPARRDLRGRSRTAPRANSMPTAWWSTSRGRPRCCAACWAS